MTRQMIFFIPFLIVMPLIFGIDGIVYTGPIADMLSAVVAIVMAIFDFRDMNRLANEKGASA